MSGFQPPLSILTAFGLGWDACEISMDSLDFRTSHFEHIEGNLEEITALNWSFSKTPPYTCQAQEWFRRDNCSIYEDASRISFLQFASYLSIHKPRAYICSVLVINWAVELLLEARPQNFSLVEHYFVANHWPGADWHWERQCSLWLVLPSPPPSLLPFHSVKLAPWSEVSLQTTGAMVLLSTDNTLSILPLASNSVLHAHKSILRIIFRVVRISLLL